MGLDHGLFLGKTENENFEQLIRWRKENWFHNWFSTRTKQFEDNDSCKITHQELRDFYQDCVTVVKSLDKSLLHKIRTEENAFVGIANGEPVFESIDLIGFDDTSIARELMPPMDGFFFGSTEITQSYYYSIDETIKELKPLIAKLDSEYKDRQFYYDSDY